MKKPLFLLLTSIFALCLSSQAQYVEPERDDTVRLYAKTPFDTVAASNALAKGTGTIKGTAFTRYMKSRGNWVTVPGKKMTIRLFPVTPYLEEYLKLKKKENPAKLQFAYMHEVPASYHLEAVTNSKGDFTFPYLKPGKYFLEATLRYARNYRDIFNPADFTYSIHYKKLEKFVEIKKPGDLKTIKLK